GRPPDREGDLGLDLTGSEQPLRVFGPPQHARLHQSFGVHGRSGIERAGVDLRLTLAEIDFVELARERRIAKAPLRQPAMERHLAAFKAFDAHTGARGLALAAAAAGLSRAGADAAADAGAFLARART